MARHFVHGTQIEEGMLNRVSACVRALWSRLELLQARRRHAVAAIDVNRPRRQRSRSPLL